MSRPTKLELVPLGGLGEFGMNLMVYRWGADSLVVDAGMMFPGEEHLGVDVVIPDLSYLESCGTLHGVVLTHGHEDHIGALPYLLARHDVPVYGTPYTLGLARRRLAEHGAAAAAGLYPLDATPVRLGPFTVEPLAAAHSIPQSRMLVVHTPLGPIVHTADFKLDPDPVDGIGTDMVRLAALGRDGVLALLSDSTNADRPGRTPGERHVLEGFEPLLARARGRVIVTTFASHIHRLELLAHLAARHGRRLALIGTSLEAHVEVAEGLGLLRWPAGVRLQADAVGTLPPEHVLAVVSGSQGEPNSAMARVAVGRHRQLAIGPGDLVVHAARQIPGNEKAIGRLINHLLRRGAEVVTAAEAPVHVSGHAAADELATLFELLRPRAFLPIHGEYRQLAAHARLARAAGLCAASVVEAESGDVVALSASGPAVVDRVPVGQVFIDESLDPVDHAVLRERRRLADDGIVVAVVALRRASGAIDGYPQILARGFVPGADGTADWIAEARRVIVDLLADALPEERGDEGLLRARVQTELGRFLRRRTGRRPLVVPVILEL